MLLLKQLRRPDRSGYGETDGNNRIAGRTGTRYKNNIKRRKKMKKTKYEKCNVSPSEVVSWCNGLSKVVESATGSQYIVKDMAISLKEWKESSFTDCGIFGTFYIAIRNNGVESGSLEEVRNRCGVLGAPIAVIKISGFGRQKVDISANISK